MTKLILLILTMIQVGCTVSPTIQMTGETGNGNDTLDKDGAWQIISVTNEGVRVKNISDNTFYIYATRSIEEKLYGTVNYHIKNDTRSGLHRYPYSFPTDSWRVKPLQLSPIQPNEDVTIWYGDNFSHFSEHDVVISFEYFSSPSKDSLVGKYILTDTLNVKNPNQRVDLTR